MGEVTAAEMVSGTSEAERMRSNAQWYEPCDLEGGGKVVASLTVPLMMANVSGRAQRVRGRVRESQKGEAEVELAQAVRQQGAGQQATLPSPPRLPTP